MTMKKNLILFVGLLVSLQLFPQIRLKGYHQDLINPELYGNWPAKWIAVPDEPVNAFGVYHFRKSFDIASIPSTFIVHVSADNRYKLFINGELIGLGPSRGDRFNWNFETIDLAPYLIQGKNTIAAVVWNYAEDRPPAQVSLDRTEFILQGNTKNEEIVNTNNSWVCTKNNAYERWRVPVYSYTVGPGELFRSESYLWGWEEIDFNDSAWKNARETQNGCMKSTVDHGGRLLVPSPIPSSELKKERFASVRLNSGADVPQDFLSNENKSVIIPADTKVRLILDQQHLTTGYLTMLFEKGKDAEIRLGYSEAYFSDMPTRRKDNRNEIDGKTFEGYEDKIIADGGRNRTFTSLWWRTWRYVEMNIETKSEPLVLKDIYGTFCAYPFTNETAFSAPGNEYLEKMLEIGWRTARLCANETYMDCPYYEQLQYFGDTRIQAMITLYNTHDVKLVKNALEQGRQSLLADGLTQSRYPTSHLQIIPPFSLWWINMGYDYWMYRGDEDYVKTLLPAYRNVLAWYEQQLKPNKSLDHVPYWFFTDWSAGLPWGEPVRDRDGNSSIQDLTFILALDAASRMEEAFGIPGMAEHYKNISESMKKTMREKYWDESRGLFADTFDHRSYSQHTNSLAILAGLVKDEEAKNVMRNLLTQKDLIQCTIYFRYYLHQALNKSGLGNELLDNLQIWKDQMALGLTTWAESPEPSRSDCHAWGSSPNIEFYRILLGIDTDAPGFRKVRITPHLGNLTVVSGSMPHPDGFISAEYNLDKSGKLKAVITLPSSLTGVFVWKNKEYPLKGGKQEFSL